MPDLVISNTSPLFYLYQLGHVDVLQKLYGHIVVPEAVVSELKAGHVQGERVPDVATYPWMTVRSVRIPSMVRLITDFGIGEAEVLALALEHPDSLVILDDRLAREVASLQNLRITGTAGILVKAKHTGYISAVAPLLNSLIRLGFRLNDDVRATILKLAGE